MSDATCHCTHSEDDHESTDLGIPLVDLGPDRWRWVTAQRCYFCACMRFRPMPAVQGVSE